MAGDARMGRVRFAAICVVVGLVGGGLVTGGSASADVPSQQTAALDVDPATIVSSTLHGDAAAIAVGAESIGGFPTQGNTYLVLSTGNATDVPGTPSAFKSTNLTGAAAGADGNDLTQLELNL